MSYLKSYCGGIGIWEECKGRSNASLKLAENISHDKKMARTITAGPFFLVVWSFLDVQAILFHFAIKSGACDP